MQEANQYGAYCLCRAACLTDIPPSGLPYMLAEGSARWERACLDAGNAVQADLRVLASVPLQRLAEGNANRQWRGGARKRPLRGRVCTKLVHCGSGLTAKWVVLGLSCRWCWLRRCLRHCRYRRHPCCRHYYCLSLSLDWGCPGVAPDWCRCGQVDLPRCVAHAQ